MDEDSMRFWIIPILAIIGVAMIFAFSLDHKYNTIIPNAAIELDDIKQMSCIDLSKRNSMGSYWTPQNGKIAREKVDVCKDMATAERTTLDESSCKQIEVMIAHDHKFTSTGNIVFAEKKIKACQEN